jgi:MFS transporter, FHS family, L-fucose permease
VHGLGRLIEHGAALLIMGIVGGALVPRLFAMLRQTLDFQLVFTALMVPC